MSESNQELTDKASPNDRADQLLALGYDARQVSQILYIAQYLDAFMLFGEFFDFRVCK